MIKPSEHASASILALMPLVEEAGFPPGVVNTVTGDGRRGMRSRAHPGVDKVAFTGGTETGRRVGVAMEHLALITLELGGKSPQIASSPPPTSRLRPPGSSPGSSRPRARPVLRAHACSCRKRNTKKYSSG